MYKDFESANNTHCKVANIFPSISASIGNYEPQSSIWKIAIYSHSPLRLYIVYLRWKYYQSVIIENCITLINLAVLLNIIENFALIALTYWNSSDNYPLHEKSFITFVSCSIAYMLLTSILLTKYRRRPLVTYKEKYSVKLKWRALVVNIMSFSLAAHFFLRHNRLCEPYVYSMFGFSEYIFVISNITFHLTTVYDLQFDYIYWTSRGLVAE